MEKYIWNDTGRKACHLTLKWVLQALMSDPESVPGVHTKEITEAEMDTICEDSG